MGAGGQAKAKAKAKAKGKAVAKAASKAAKAATKASAKAAAKAAALAAAQDGAQGDADAGAGDASLGSSRPSALDIINPKDGLGQKGAQAVMDHLTRITKRDPTKAHLIDHWKSLPRGDAKLEFALKLKVDKEASFMMLKETHETGSSKGTRVTQMWFTEDQIAKEEGLTNYLDNPIQQQKLKDILEGLPSRPHERNDLAAKQYKQYDYSQKLTMMDQYQKSSMQLSAEAEVADYKDFDPMQQTLLDASGLGCSSTTRMLPKPKPPPRQPKELTEDGKKKEEWLKDVRSLQKELQSLSKLFLSFKVKGSQLLKDPQSGVTRELMTALDNNYKQSMQQDETISQLLFRHTPMAAEHMEYTKAAPIIKKAKDFLQTCQDLKSRGCRIIGK
jgi:arsenate reductase-like glutaredoxin family protein